MKKSLLLLLILTLIAAPASHAKIKRADLAGSWYSSSHAILKGQLRAYLSKADPPAIDGEIVALISPHAGFAYSGPVAAYGFKAVEGKDIKTVIVVGFSHRIYYGGIAVLDEEAFETPLGVVKINRALSREIIEKNAKIYNYPVAFSSENSVEMEIPFLQMVLKDFEVVLIAIGEQSLENGRILGEALYEVLKDREKFLLVASTDMSHYLPYDTAMEIDGKTISLIKKFDPDGLYIESAASGHKLMCGVGAVYTTMLAAKSLGADKVEILKYANSGDVAGNRENVVGYLSAAMVKSRSAKSPAVPSPADRQGKLPIGKVAGLAKQGEKNMLNEAQRKKMLTLARDSIKFYLKNRKPLPVKESDPVLNKEMGAFVTLHEHGRLRGCIGNLVGRGPFYLTVRDMAVQAATDDPRFSPVRLEEMSDIDIEISALSPMEKIDDPEKIVMEKHGVLVKSGFTSGVYLPQVATETGWSREEFMNSLCGQKARMTPDAWKTGKCEIYIFTAEVFGEK